jgi:uncharacterized protein
LSKKKLKNKKQVKSSSWNKRNILIALILVAVLTSVYFLFLKKPKEPQFVKEGEVTFLKKDKQFVKRIDVEVAKIPQRRSLGLMYRTHMDEDKGMLFIFDHPDKESFWMKNTIIPLDIMFIDSVGVIDTIYRRTTPYSERSLPSRRKIQFVVEVNGGWADKNSIKESDLIEFKIDK